MPPGAFASAPEGDPRAADRTAAAHDTPGVGTYRGRDGSYAPKSGTEIDPSSCSGKPGLWATSQTCPSGSVKQPA